ncbi:acetyl-CoA carboxylase biotin carboxyl carrier protein [Sphingomonas sp. NCPPB 2930]
MPQDVRALVEALMDVMGTSDLSELEFAQDGTTIRLTRGDPAVGASHARRAPAVPADAAALPAFQPDVAPHVPQPGQASASASASGQTLRSPLFGTVHLLPAPGQPPFARIGDRVSAGQTLCTVEAMKMFHEVEAEAGGTLRAVLVAGGQEVDAGQPLFTIG